jgi:hypothetical protein
VRTIVLMVLALFAFAWMWVQTHRQQAVKTLPAPRQATPVKLIPAPAGGDR